MTDQEPAKTIRLLLIDDHQVFRGALARMLAAEPGFEVVGQCSSIEEGLRIAKSQPADVVLLDLDLAGEDGGEFFFRARAQALPARVLMLTGMLNAVQIAELLAEGAAGVYLKTSPIEMLADSIRQVASGGTWLDRDYVDKLRHRAPGSGGKPPRLSDRERAVMAAILEGQPNKEIAARLELPESLVKAVVRGLFQKTGAQNRGQLIRAALADYLDQLR